MHQHGQDCNVPAAFIRKEGTAHEDICHRQKRTWADAYRKVRKYLIVLQTISVNSSRRLRGGGILVEEVKEQSPRFERGLCHACGTGQK